MSNLELRGRTRRLAWAPLTELPIPEARCVGDLSREWRIFAYKHPTDIRGWRWCGTLRQDVFARAIVNYQTGHQELVDNPRYVRVTGRLAHARGRALSR